jgi:hypothetical protein
MGAALDRGTVLGDRGVMTFLDGPEGPEERAEPRADELRVGRAKSAEFPPLGNWSWISCWFFGTDPDPRWEATLGATHSGVAGTSLIGLFLGDSLGGDRLLRPSSGWLLGVPRYAASGTWPEVWRPVEDIPLIIGTTIMDVACGLPVSSMICSRGGSHEGRAKRSGPAPAEFPPLSGATEGLPLGEMSIRGEFVMVGAGEFGCDQNVVLAS